jgi:AraC family L-rhamnose operon regulatory protein RhaS
MGENRTNRPVQVTIPPGGVSLFESHHDSDFAMEFQRNAFLVVLYVLRGDGDFFTENRSWAIKASDVIVVPRGESYRIADHPGHPLSVYGLCVDAGALASMVNLEPLLPAGRLPRIDLLAAQVRSDLRRLFYEQTLARTASSAFLLGITLQLLGLLARAGGRRVDHGSSKPSVADHRARVEEFVAELDRRFYENSTLDRVAAELGMSRRRFTQLFREVTGNTWLGHVRALRVAHAKRLLRDTSRSVISIAFECGYEDLSSFYRAFRRELRSCPSRWRMRG